MEDFRDQEADVVANLGAEEHVPHEPSADWLHWEQAEAMGNVWLLVGPKPTVSVRWDLINAFANYSYLKRQECRQLTTKKTA
eukprot:2635662-Amphidinium_carterae.1